MSIPHPVPRGERRSLRWSRVLPLIVALVVAVVLVVAWNFWLSPIAQARGVLLHLGSPLSGVKASEVSTAHPDCEGTSTCVSVSRSWTPAQSLTLAGFDSLARRWVAEHRLGAGEWTCGPQQGAFGIASPGGGCSMALTAPGKGHTPVFLWVSFRDSAALAAAYAQSSRNVPANEIADPLGRVGSLELARVNLQVVSTRWELWN
jgi:hypothetical protein